MSFTKTYNQDSTNKRGKYKSTTTLVTVPLLTLLMTNTVIIEGIPYTLPQLEQDCWARLLNGALKSKDAFHNPVLGTYNTNGISLRTVVLRKVITANKQLIFNTDTRSGKVTDILANPNISWLFYNQSSRIQIRVGATAIVHTTSELGTQAWDRTNATCRKVYMGLQAPGTINATPTSGLTTALEQQDPLLPDTEVAKENFATVVTTACYMEWLWLNSRGHRRAVFHYNNGLLNSSNWLVP